jgi:hypothetical protein
MFFKSKDLDLAHAAPGSFAIMPSTAMIEPLRKDYEAMAGMVFGTLPDFNTLLAEIQSLQNRLNRPRRKGGR